MNDEKMRIRSSDIPSVINETNCAIDREYLHQMVDVSKGYIQRAENLARIKENSALNVLRQALESIIHALYYQPYLEIRQFNQINGNEGSHVSMYATTADSVFMKKHFEILLAQ